MPDIFENQADSLVSSAASAFAVTPHDSNELAMIPKALYIGGAGSLSVTLKNDSTPVTFQVLAGAILPIRPRLVRATGTTATGIVALD